MKENEILEEIHKRLGWIMFWIIVMGLVISSNVSDLGFYLN